MKKTIISLAAALVLASCGDGANNDSAALAAGASASPASNNVGKIKLSDINLGNMDEAKRIEEALGEDGSSFMYYVVRHAETRAGLSSALLKPDGSEPETVAEAVAVAKVAKEKRKADREAS